MSMVSMFGTHCLLTHLQTDWKFCIILMIFMEMQLLLKETGKLLKEQIIVVNGITGMVQLDYETLEIMT